MLNLDKIDILVIGICSGIALAAIMPWVGALIYLNPWLFLLLAIPAFGPTLLRVITRTKGRTDATPD